MPAALSKEKDNNAEAAAAVAQKKKQVFALNLSVFQSVVQHIITLQSEPMLVRELCNNDSSRTATLLANTTGLVGFLSLFLNQAGGKFTDVVGRKPGLLLGPIVNIFLGALAASNSSSLTAVLTCRVLRLIVTTFSNTVVVTASLMDICSGKDLGVAFTQMGATIGIAVILGPIMESIILKRTGHPRYSYFALSFFALVQAVFNMMQQETLDKARRAAMHTVMKLETFNPFGFASVYTRGTKKLQSAVTITTLQMALEGKNLSDLGQIWQRLHLKWGVSEIRNFVVAYGIACAIAGAKLTPYMLKTRSAYDFTSQTNVVNVLAYFLRPLSENPMFYCCVTPLLLPGVNGASASALKAVSSDLASAEGFLKGEFSGYVNNLRAVTGAVAPVIYGNWYAWCARRGIYPGTTWWIAGLIGAIMPQYILWRTQCCKPTPLELDGGSTK